MISLGRRVYGLGAVALGLIGLWWGDFALVWQPVPAGVPYRQALAYAAATALLLAGVMINFRRTAAWGSGALAMLYALCVVLLHGPRIAAHPLSFQPWDGAAEQLALAAGGLLALLASLRGGAQAGRFRRIGQVAFALCLIIFGLAHFLYLDFTAAMVPKWLPPSRTFWAWATGAAHIAAGLAIVTGVQARLAGILLVVMFAAFGILVHAPLLLANPASHMNWTSNAVNLALTGAAWVLAESLGKKR